MSGFRFTVGKLGVINGGERSVISCHVTSRLVTSRSSALTSAVIFYANLPDKKRKLVCISERKLANVRARQ